MSSSPSPAMAASPLLASTPPDTTEAFTASPSPPSAAAWNAMKRTVRRLTTNNNSSRRDVRLLRNKVNYQQRQMRETNSKLEQYGKLLDEQNLKIEAMLKELRPRSSQSTTGKNSQ